MVSPPQMPVPLKHMYNADFPLHDNLHLDNSNGITYKFNDILTCFDLKQHVNFPTHVHGHWLDLLITKRMSNSIKSVFFRQQASQTILRSYQKLTVVRRN